MEKIIADIKNELLLIIDNIENTMINNEALNYDRRDWSYPGISKRELIIEAQNIINFININDIKDTDQVHDILIRYLRSLEFLRENSLRNIVGNADKIVPIYLITIRSILTSLEEFLEKDDKDELIQRLTISRRKVRSLESSLNNLEPRATSLKDIVTRIEQAHEAAEQLPTDLESLSEARKSVAKFATDAKKDKEDISQFKIEIEQIRDKMNEKATEAETILKNCEKAYAAATSVGLAAAFTERSDKLSTSMWVWVVGLIFSLFAGGYFGSSQLQKLLELLSQKDISTTSMSINFIMAILSIGAPIWFSWLATKQIGQRFKLAEDYAFKASVSRAYEGFRKEASRFDKDMEAKLLNSALTRLDELPLRLVENESHGSPWHELASSNIFKEAMAKVPGFTEKVKKLAQDNIQANFDISPNKPTKKQVQNEENE